MIEEESAPAATATMVATNLTLRPPAQFDFRNPDDWPKWKRRFTQYLAATGHDKGDSKENIWCTSTHAKWY